MGVDDRFCPSCGSPRGSGGAAPEASVSLTHAPTAAPGPVASAVADAFPAAGSGRPGFPPGHILAGRYRIVGILGRGGMGEVYRADDLKLGAPVALKFLPSATQRDPHVIERFHAEVRNARQVSHPHVCRVYDIGEVGERHFLTMEYVDGEDLATLLRRIGRLPPAKAVEIARQLATGLAAAHEKGLLHRDLKPANIMIDGHGRARITDFGLAVVEGDASAEIAGTPAYMAPEQLDGLPATIHSDIYALGLVLYELFTGKRPFEAASMVEWRRLRSGSVPPSPSTHTSDMDPVVERLVLRCLESEPSLRPRSAAQVALALPGGDPLTAALAAGETPSPEMVAATGGEGALAPARAWLALGSLLAILAVIAFLIPASTDLGLAPMETSPGTLRDSARAAARELGYGERPVDEATWLRRDYQPIRWLADSTVSTSWRRRLREMGAPVLLVYRSSRRPLVPSGAPGFVTATDPAPSPGDLLMVVDDRGRVREFLAEPERWTGPGPGKGSRPAPESARDTLPFPEDVVFRETGLDRSRFSPVPPERVPSTAFDDRREWMGSRAEAPEMRLRLSAATWQGRLVSIDVTGPWGDRTVRDILRNSVSGRISNLSLAALFLAVVVAALAFARRNIRMGRGDRRGAYRVGVAGFFLSIGLWAVAAHHAVDWGSILDMPLLGGLRDAAVSGGLLWLAYLALEPYLRRRMPDLLVGWARVLEGRIRDPRVGRDALIGMMAGAFVAMTVHLVNGLPTWIPLASQTTIPTFNLARAGRLVPLAPPFQAATDAMGRTMVSLMLLFIIRLVTSRTWVAIAILSVIGALTALGQENPLLETPQAIVGGLTMALLIVKAGPLATGVAWFTCVLLLNSTIRVESSVWYAPYAVAAVITVLGLAIWAFRTSLGGRSPFGRLSIDG